MMDLRTPRPPKSQALRFQDPGRAPGRGADPPQAAASPALPAVAGGHAGFRGRCAANRDGVDQSPPCACSASHLRGRARRRRDAALGGPPPRSRHGRHAPLAPEHSDGWALEGGWTGRKSWNNCIPLHTPGAVKSYLSSSKNLSMPANKCIGSLYNHQLVKSFPDNQIATVTVRRDLPPVLALPQAQGPRPKL